jgi:Protein of unknown function (DUF4232)
MSPDLKDLFDDAGRTPPSGRGYDADEVVRRGGRIRTRRRVLTGAAALGVAAVVVGGSIALASPGLRGGTVEPGGTTSASPSATGAPSGDPTAPTKPTPTATGPSPTATSVRCTSEQVSVTLGTVEGTAGTTFYRLLIKAKPGMACTTGGFAAVFVVRPEGDPIGPAEYPPAADGAAIVVEGPQVASFPVGIAESGNYDPAVCLPVAATALRVTLPGDEATADVRLPGGVTVCSGNVSAFGSQLTVGPIDAGNGGEPLQ